MEDGPLDEMVERIAPYKTLVVELYDDKAVSHDKAELYSIEGNVAKYRFMKKEITAAQLIQDLSAKMDIKDVTIEEASIDDVIRIAYRQ